MNRVIKFRFWDIRTRFMYPGQDLRFISENTEVNDNLISMQFTGWIRGGKEVYVGDIVMVKGTKRTGNYLTEVIETSYGFSIKENHTYLIGTAISTVIIDVLGNIYENPKLLTTQL